VFVYYVLGWPAFLGCVEASAFGVFGCSFADSFWASVEGGAPSLFYEVHAVSVAHAEGEGWHAVASSSNAVAVDACLAPHDACYEGFDSFLSISGASLNFTRRHLSPFSQSFLPGARAFLTSLMALSSPPSGLSRTG